MIYVEKTQNLVKTSYSSDDVIILLKDLTNSMKELSTEDREKLIQAGTHYSEMLPEEKAPSQEYKDLYERALKSKAYDIAYGVARISEMIMHRCKNNKQPVLISLARAGIPIGILMKRYIKQTYNIDVPHYAISIIRDRGIDENAMEYIYNQHGKELGVENFFFVDGWVGKGAIQRQLVEAVEKLRYSNEKWRKLSSDLVTLADPAYVTKLCGTRSDYLIPCACLNSTVSGLISRTILNSKIHVDKGDFHGAVYFKKFEQIDKSNEFIDTITDQYKYLSAIDYTECVMALDGRLGGIDTVVRICADYGIADYKKVKPGIGETTRVLLRRVPWKVLINTTTNRDDPDIQHILVLCKDKNVPVERHDIGNYKVCGIIKELSADA